MTIPRARIRGMDGGEVVIDDPDALEVIEALAKLGCRETMQLHTDRIAHFVARVEQRGLAPADVVIVILAVDDPFGGPLAELLMPGHSWQAYRERGEVPYARGLAGRKGMEDALALFDSRAADKLRAFEGLAVVVVDCEAADAFATAETTKAG